MTDYSLALQNLINVVETVLGDKATKNGKIDLDNKDEVSCFTTMLEETRKNNPNVKFDEHEIARILGFEKSDMINPMPGVQNIMQKIGFEEYDEKGRLTKYVIDKNDDGRPEFIKTYEYDERGHLTKRVLDEYRYSKPQHHVETWEYAENGIYTKYKYAADNNGDGRPDFIQNKNYNERGELTKHVKDENGNGKPDFIETHEYDEKGRLIKSTIDWKGNGKHTSINTWEYDENGHVSEHVRGKKGKTSK